MKSFAVLILLTLASFAALMLHPTDPRFIAGFIIMLALCALWLGVDQLRHSSALIGYFLILIAVGMCGVIVLAPIVKAKGWLQNPQSSVSDEKASINLE
jgi:4-amino-4-deoxy-L-arabinose transferase-like glycosyltransferase